MMELHVGNVTELCVIFKQTPDGVLKASL
jgi:hypothetical protein